MRRGPRAFNRVLVAAAVLVLVGSSAALASGNTCSPLLPGTGLTPPPNGDFFETSGPAGLLDGNSVGYAECQVGSDFYIPFFESHPAKMTLALAAFDGTPGSGVNFAFDFSSVLSNGIGSPTEFTATTDSNGDISTLSVVVPGGLDVLAITDSSLINASSGTTDDFQISLQFNNFINSIPEPATITLLGFGVAGLMVMRRRQPRRT
jgi:hypothetical protein